MGAAWSHSRVAMPSHGFLRDKGIPCEHSFGYHLPLCFALPARQGSMSPLLFIAVDERLGIENERKRGEIAAT